MERSYKFRRVGVIVNLLQKCGSMARGAAAAVSPLFETDSITDVLGLRTATHAYRTRTSFYKCFY